MSTSHPPAVYTSSYHHQLAPHPHHQQPQQPQHPYQQPHPVSNHHPSGPVQIVRSGSKDSNSSGQPSPRRDGRDGRDSYASRDRREVGDPRVERKTRPATIAELAHKSSEDPWDPTKHLKHWLRTAELARKSGKQHAENGDYERSFVQLARAATIILQWMPHHKDYDTLLNQDQRRNLTLVSPSLPFIPLQNRVWLRLVFSSPSITLSGSSLFLPKKSFRLSLLISPRSYSFSRPLLA